MPPPPVKKLCLGGQSEALEGSIRFTVENVSKMADDDQQFSPIVVIGGFPWRIQVTKTPREGGDGAFDMGFYILCTKCKESNIWYCESSLTQTLVNQLNAEHSISESFSHRYDFAAAGNYGYNDFIDWVELLDPSKGFIKNDSIVVEAHISVKSRPGNGFRTKVDYDFFTPSEKADVILVVSDKEFHVSKQLLAIQSSYFEALFYKDFNEKDKTKIILEDISAKEFECLLRVLYRMGEPFKSWNIEGILRLAEMWEIKSVTDEVEKHLLTTDSITSCHKLQLADNYRLRMLYDQCIAQLTTCHQITHLQATKEYAKCSGETKEALFKLYTKLCACNKETITIAI